MESSDGKGAAWMNWEEPEGWDHSYTSQEETLWGKVVWGKWYIWDNFKFLWHREHTEKWWLTYKNLPPRIWAKKNWSD